MRSTQGAYDQETRRLVLKEMNAPDVNTVGILKLLAHEKAHCVL